MTQSNVASNVTDLRDIPLSLVPTSDVDRILGRVLPEVVSVEPVSVAAFNSSI
jgi:FXSXX-COOH protein